MSRSEAQQMLSALVCRLFCLSLLAGAELEAEAAIKLSSCGCFPRNF